MKWCLFFVALSFSLFSREIQVSGTGRLEISQGNKECLTFLGEKSTSKEIDNVLIIELLNEETAMLTVKTLSCLEASGDVLVDLDGIVQKSLCLTSYGEAAMIEGALKCGRLITNLFGNTRAELRGDVEKQIITIQGEGVCDAKHLKTAETTVHIQGKGKAYVQAEKRLDTSTHGEGAVYYFGTPLELQTNGVVAHGE